MPRPLAARPAAGTYFNALTQVCDFKDNVPGCNGKCITPAYAVAATPELSILGAAIAVRGPSQPVSALAPCLCSSRS